MNNVLVVVVIQVGADEVLHLALWLLHDRHVPPHQAGGQPRRQGELERNLIVPIPQDRLCEDVNHLLFIEYHVSRGGLLIPVLSMEQE